LVLAGIAFIFGIASILVDGRSWGTGIWGTFFTWPAGTLGIFGARNVPNQRSLLTAHMTFVSFEI